MTTNAMMMHSVVNSLEFSDKCGHDHEARAQRILSALKPWLKQDQEPAPPPTLAEGKLFGEINALKKELLHLKEHVVSSNDYVINFGLRVSSLMDRVLALEQSLGRISSIEDRLRKLEQKQTPQQ